MSKFTRIATTMVGRYPEQDKTRESYFLDGRVAREGEQTTNVTLDREDRGFFYAIYSAPEALGRDEHRGFSGSRQTLERIMDDMKNQPQRNIDEEINELADAAVMVSGRLTLDNDESKQPYFAGLMIKDAELAAVTLGWGCAYLYRQDILYPLTDDDLALEAIDTDGAPVPNFDIYKAGSAATIRYSNIAPLQGDDCIILCSKEVMQCIPQREMLKLLFDAEDASDAADRVLSLCAERIPEKNVQFMIGFVEAVTTDEKLRRNVAQSIAPKDTTGKLPATAAFAQQNAQSSDYYEHEEETELFEEPARSHTGLKALLIILILIALLLGLFFLGHQMGWTQPLMNRFFPTTTIEETTLPEPTTVATTTVPTTTKATTTAAPTTTQAQLRKHIIEEGETLYEIVLNEYNLDEDQMDQIEEIMTKIKKANPDVFQGENGDLYEAGSEIVLPDLSASSN